MANSVLKRFTAFSFGGWISAFIGLVSTPIITRFINPEEFGKASMFILAINLLQQINLLGLDQSYIRFFNEIPSEKKKKLLKKLIIIISLTSLILIGAIFLFWKEVSFILFDENYKSIISLLCLAIFLSSLFRIIHSNIRMSNKGLQYSLLLIIQSSFSLLFTVIFAVYVTQEFHAIVYGFTASLLVTLGFSLYLTKNLKYSTSGNLVEEKNSELTLKQLLTYGLPFVPTFLISWLFQTVDRTYLRLFSDFNEIGVYSASLKIAASLVVLQTGFGAFWVPFSYEQYAKDKDNKEFYATAFNAVFLLFSLAIVILLVFDKLIILLFPPEYSNIINIFPFLLFPPMFFTLSEVTVVGINFAKRTRLHLYVIILSLLINASVGYFTIQSFGALGAAISMAVGHLFFFIFRTIFSLRLYPVHYNFKKMAFCFLALFAFICIGYLANDSLKHISAVLFLLIMSLLYKDIIKHLLSLIKLK